MLKTIAFEFLSSEQYSRIQKDGIYIGSVYLKVLYREFTDDKFSTEVLREEDEEHLGILGPFIKAEVGDTVEIVFKNMATRNYSIHAQGIRYNKLFEGWKYEDGEVNNDGDSLPPEDVFVYRWEVPKSSGPTSKGHN